MKQPLSYQLLKPFQKIFVLEFLRCGCNARQAVDNIYGTDNTKSNSSRTSRLINNPAILAAIEDKIDLTMTQHSTTKDAMTERLFSLIEQVSQLEEGQQKLSHLRFILDVYAEVNKISGLHSMRHTHEEKRSIEISFGGMDDDDRSLPEAEILSLPEEHVPETVPYDLSDIDHISSEDDDLEQDSTNDPT